MRTNLSGLAAAVVGVAVGSLLPPLTSVASAAAPDPLDAWSTSVRLGDGPTPALPIAFENGRFYMPGGTFSGVEGTMRSSADGITWASPTAMIMHNSVTALGYANNTYVLGCKNGDVYTSANGTAWTKSGSSLNTELRELAYGNGVWAFAGGHGVVTSRDLATWTYTPIPGQTVNETGIVFANGLFVGASQGGIATSPDAVTWTPRVSGVSLNAVENANGTFVAVGAAGAIETSNDAITWTRRPAPTGNPNLLSVAYGKGGWVAVGNVGGTSPGVFASPTGATWSQHSFAASATLLSIAFGNDAYVISGLGTDGVVAYASGTYSSAATAGAIHTVLTNPTPVSRPPAMTSPITVGKP